MPPKSASKKEAPMWYTCEKCSLIIMGKPSSNSHLDCNLDATGSYIDVSDEKAPIYKPSHLEIKSTFNEENALGKHQLNNLIFVNMNVLKLGKFIIGEHVLVESFEKTGSLKHRKVKLIWPVNDKAVDVVRVTKDEIFRWKGEALVLKIKKLDSELRPANEVHVKCLEDSYLSEDLRQNLTHILRKEFSGHVFSKGDELRLTFMCKEFKFRIESFEGSDAPDLDLQLKNLTLNEETAFYEVKSSTKFLIKTDKAFDTHTAVRKIYIGGLDKYQQEIQEIIDSKRCKSGLTKGILLHGSSGCGKTLLVKQLLSTTSEKYIQINASEIFSRYYGETEANLTAVFEKAKENFPNLTLIIVEEIQNVCPKSDNSDILRRVTSSFNSLLDQVSENVLIIATTNQLDAVHPSIRRSGRLDYEIEIPVPTAKARQEIFHVLLVKHNIQLTEDEITSLAQVTHGYTGADLESVLTKTICSCKGSVQYSDVVNSLTHVKPSAMREIQIESPNIKWEDIGGQHDLKLKLQQAIEWPIKYPETFVRLGITPPKGLLMFGPPGCSKTMIAKALATESGLNFLSIKGSELFSMWVGESEKAVRRLFQKAREVAPAIIFFDEIDAIGGERGAEGGGTSVKERVLSQILTEIDGVHALKDVTIVAATNRPDLIDKALMRPGRLDRIVYVGLPDKDTRLEIFKIKFRKMPIHEDVKVDDLVELTEGYSGAEIQAVCQEAALHALERSFEVQFITVQDFEYALKFVQPRTTRDLLELYESYLMKYKFK